MCNESVILCRNMHVFNNATGAAPVALLKTCILRHAPVVHARTAILLILTGFY